MKLRTAPATDRLLNIFANDPPHALLLTGPVGVGLCTVAKELSGRGGRLLKVVRPESKSTALASISTEAVRQLYIDTRARLKGKNFVVIDDADTMNVTAQNSLLKLLEEPNESICFILTSHNPDKLLPTIRSRVQTFTVPPLDKLESRRLLKSLGVKSELDEQRLLYVAEGLPAELTRLVTNESDFKSLTECVQQARQIVEGTQYQRLALVSMLPADRAAAVRLIDMTTLLLRRSLTQRPERATLQRIDALLQAATAIRANGNVKLHLASAVIQ